MGNNLTKKILIAMLVGAICGTCIRFLPASASAVSNFADHILSLGGNIFISLMKMLVVPLVFISIVCGICSLEKVGSVGSLGIKTLKWFLITTVIATLFGLITAYFSKIGVGLHITAVASFKDGVTASLWQTIGDVVPSNPIKAMADANVLQVVVFAILFGVAVNISGEHGRRIAAIFTDLNAVMMKFILMLMAVVPYGVFCLITVLFIEQGFALILGILNYFLLMFAVFCLHAIATFSFFLRAHKLSPKVFFKKMYSTLLFAFSVASSNASIPMMLDTAENKLGVGKGIASFVIPLGTNMNKNGSAIMYAIASVFIANAYQIPLGLVGYVTLFFMTILISVGTAGAPGVAMVTLVVILKQLGIPPEGIALIIGVDRLLDMMRTVVNVAGNTMVACLVASSEKQLDHAMFHE